MTGVAMEISWDDADAVAAMQRLREFPDQADAMWNAIGGAMVSSTQLRFRGQHGPDGEPWKPSERVIKHGGATLIEHGYLLASQTYNVLSGGDGVEWGSPLIYAAIHQVGGDIHREAHEHTIYKRQAKSGEVGNRFVQKSKSNFAQDVHVGAYDIHIPARPYLGIDEQDEANIEHIAVTHMNAALFGGAAS